MWFPPEGRRSKRVKFLEECELRYPFRDSNSLRALITIDKAPLHLRVISIGLTTSKISISDGRKFIWYTHNPGI